MDGAYLELENRKLFSRQTEAVTVAFWTKADAYPPSSRLVQKGRTGDEWQVEINYKGEFVWTVFTKNNVTVYTKVPPVGQWVHVACVYQAGVARVYFNGKEVNSRTIKDPGDFYCTRWPVIVGGGLNEKDLLVYPYSGGFDDFRVYNRVLAADEIATLARRP